MVPEWILTLVLPPRQASATVGDLVEANASRIAVWIAALRIAGAAMIQQCISSPREVAKSLGYAYLLLVQFGVVYLALLVLGVRSVRVKAGWWVFGLTMVSMVAAELSIALPLRKHAASERSISRFAYGTRWAVLLAQVLWIVTSDLATQNLEYDFGLAMILGVLLPIQLGRRVAWKKPDRELATWLGIALVWGTVWVVRFSSNSSWTWVIHNPDPVFIPMMLVGIVSARRARVHEQEAA